MGQLRGTLKSIYSTLSAMCRNIFMTLVKSGRKSQSIVAESLTEYLIILYNTNRFFLALLFKYQIQNDIQTPFYARIIFSDSMLRRSMHQTCLLSQCTIVGVWCVECVLWCTCIIGYLVRSKKICISAVNRLLFMPKMCTN